MALLIKIILASSLGIAAFAIGVGIFFKGSLISALGIWPLAKSAINTEIVLMRRSSADEILSSTVIAEEMRLSSTVDRPLSLSTWLLEGEAMVIDLPHSGSIYIVPIGASTGPLNRSVPLIVDACGEPPPRLYASGEVVREAQIAWINAVSSISPCTITSGLPILHYQHQSSSLTWISIEELSNLLGHQKGELAFYISPTEQGPTLSNRGAMERLVQSVNFFGLQVVNPVTGTVVPIDEEYFASYL